jgi:hypothetical protein
MEERLQLERGHPDLDRSHDARYVPLIDDYIGTWMLDDRMEKHRGLTTAVTEESLEAVCFAPTTTLGICLQGVVVGLDVDLDKRIAVAIEF